MFVADAGLEKFIGGKCGVVGSFEYGDRNEHTRRAYGRIVGRFLIWCDQRGLVLHNITPGLAGEYVSQLEGSAPTKNQALAALRHFFDALVQRHAVPLNSFASVRGQKPGTMLFHPRRRCPRFRNGWDILTSRLRPSMIAARRGGRQSLHRRSFPPSRPSNFPEARAVRR